MSGRMMLAATATVMVEEVETPVGTITTKSQQARGENTHAHDETLSTTILSFSAFSCSLPMSFLRVTIH